MLVLAGAVSAEASNSPPEQTVFFVVCAALVMQRYEYSNSVHLLVVGSVSWQVDVVTAQLLSLRKAWQVSIALAAQAYW